MTTAQGAAAPSKEEFRSWFTNQVTEVVSEAVSKGLVDITNATKVVETKVEEMEQKFAAYEKAGRTHSLPGSEDSTHKGEGYRFDKVALGLISGDLDRYCPHEAEMSRQVYAQGTVPDTAGGFLVPTQVFEDQIIPLLRPQVIVYDLGIRQLPVSGAGVIEIPKEITGPVVDEVAENQANTPTDLTFGSHRIEPRTAQSYVKASRKFLSLGVGADSFIRTRMAEEIGIKMNSWVLKGTGVDGQPRGVYVESGTSEIDFTGTVASGSVLPAFYEKMLAMEDALDDANAMNGASSLGWAVANKFARATRQIKSETASSAGDPVLEMDRKVVTSGPNPRLLDYPYRKSTQLAQGANTEAIFGDWSKCVLATWNNLSLEASNVSGDALEKRQTHIVAYMDVDVAVTRPEAFAIVTNLDTSSI